MDSPFFKGGYRGIFGMNLPFNKGLQQFARDLRKNMTDAKSAYGPESEESN